MTHAGSAEPSEAAWARFGRLAVLAEDGLRARIEHPAGKVAHELSLEQRLREVIREELGPLLARLDKIERAVGVKPPSLNVSAPSATSAPHMVEAGQYGPGLPARRMTRAEFLASLPPIEPDRWVTTIAAAEKLGVRPRTMEHWRRQGRGPSFRRVGRVVRYDMRELEQISSGRIEGAP
jgi:hypothetical protein